jgi:hypothetical protein
MPKGFVFCVATGLSLLIIAGEGVAANSDFTIETLNASIESQKGEKLRVAFATDGQPALLFRPDRGAWEWSGTSKLFIPVENPGDEPLTLLLRIESAPRGSLSGKVAMAPRSVSDLAIRLDAPAPRAMGMIAAPLFEAAGLEPHTLPVTATEGSIDTSRVTSVYLGISRPPTLQRLTVGPLRAEPPGDAERTAYDGIVDAFGQFRSGTWPEKVSSAEMLRARGAEEAKELDQWRADAPKRDRFGGLLGSSGFRATGFFHTEQLAGRWWLVTPAGNPFFSIGIDAVAASGATYVDGRELMFRDLPARDGELAAHWSERDDRCGLGAQRGRSYDHGNAFDFHTANLERKFGSDWRPLARRDIGAARSLELQHDRQLERPRSMGDAATALHGAAVARGGVCQSQLRGRLVGTDAGPL